MFKECGRRTTYDGRRRTDNGACLYYNLTYESKGSGELKKQLSVLEIEGFCKIRHYITKENICVLKTSILSQTCTWMAKGLLLISTPVLLLSVRSA